MDFEFSFPFLKCADVGIICYIIKWICHNIWATFIYSITIYRYRRILYFDKNQRKTANAFLFVDFPSMAERTTDSKNILASDCCLSDDLRDWVATWVGEHSAHDDNKHQRLNVLNNKTSQFGSGIWQQRIAYTLRETSNLFRLFLSHTIFLFFFPFRWNAY